MVEQDGIEPILTRGLPPSVSTLEQALDKIESMHQEQFGGYVGEEVVAEDSIEFTITRGSPMVSAWR